MSIESTYRKILTENFLLDELKKGEVPSAEDLSDMVEELLATLDLTKPQFNADTYKVQEEASSSSSLFNQAQKNILQDVRALYKDMIELTEVSVSAYERWQTESDQLEKRLENLEDRIQNLLLLTRDTEGYHSYLVDNFVDMSLIDRDETTATVDPSTQLVTLGPTNVNDTRIYLNDISADDISFRVRTTVDMVSRTDAVGASLTNIFTQRNSAWYTNISMRKNKPVTCELTVRLAEAPVALSKIVVKLHDSSRSSPMSVTPLYSTDNFNFSQLPTNTYTQEVRGLATFQFEEVEATWVKFVLVKPGPDPVSNTDLSVFQFGFREIAFYSEGFDSSETQTVISSVLSIPRASDPNQLVEFSKISLEVCERVEAGTSINYFVTAGNSPTLPVNNSTVWVPITPIGRASGSQTRVAELGDIQVAEVGVDEEVTLAYEPLNTNDDLINPGASFHLLSQETDGSILDSDVQASDVRYIFTNPNDAILNYQIKDVEYDDPDSAEALTMDEDSIVIFRNVGSQGLDPVSDSDQVRDVQRGWRFEEPYFITVVEITKPEGITIDFGDQPVIIDDIRYTNVVGPEVLSGKTPSSKGIHVVKVHKDNWLAIDPDLTTLDDIQEQDTLYPYNHKLLIEGYAYPANYDNSQERVYVGVNLFASELMKRVSVFDLGHSVGESQWKFFALDRDAPGTHNLQDDAENGATRVFVVKVNKDIADFPNERFVIRFNLVNQRYKYLRFRADLSTTSDVVSPALDSYKIKLGG